jgi:hypothetical protein
MVPGVSDEPFSFIFKVAESMEKLLLIIRKRFKKKRVWPN